MRTVAYRLVLALIFTLPWENVIAFSSVGRISKAVGAIVALFWLLTVFATGDFRRGRAFHVAALLFVLWNGLSMMWSADPGATLVRTLTYAQLFVLAYIVWDTVVTLARLQSALQAYVLGAWLSTIVMFVDYATRGAGSEVHGRVTAGSFHPNDLGLVLALGIPMAWYLGTVAAGAGRYRALQWFNLLYVPAAPVAILLTGSRAGVGAMGAGLVYPGMALVRRGRLPGILALSSLVVLYLAVQSFIPVKALTRLETTQADITQGGLTGRTELWRGAWDVFLSHPLLGIGGGAFRSVDLESGKVEHNLVLALLAELGIIGFVLFVAIICSALACMGRQPGELLWMWVGVFTGWFLAAGLHNWEYRKQTWFLFALIIAGGNLLKGGDSSDSTAEALPPPGVGHPQRGAVRAPLP